MKLRIHPAHIGMIIVIAIALLLGWACAHAGAEPVKPYELLKAELSGDDPYTVPIFRLNAAMVAVMQRDFPDGLSCYIQCLLIACNSKDHPLNKVVFLCFNASQVFPEAKEDFIRIAQQICPKSRVSDKVVVEKATNDLGEDLYTPFNFSGIAPPPDIFSPITEVQDHRPK